MKSAVYTKAGQVGLAEIDRPQIEAPVMPLFALFVLAFVDLTSGVTVIPKSKKGIVIVVMRLSESSKKLVRLSLL